MAAKASAYDTRRHRRRDRLPRRGSASDPLYPDAQRLPWMSLHSAAFCSGQQSAIAPVRPSRRPPVLVLKSYPMTVYALIAIADYSGDHFDLQAVRSSK